MNTPRHLLVVEDDDDDFFLLSRELRKLGLNSVSRVADGKAALDYLAGKNGFANRTEHPFPDVVFLDLKLPEMMGHDVLAAIRREPAWNDLRVYVLTGSDEHRDRQRVEAIGCAGYYVKPIARAQLEELFRVR